MEDEQTVHCPWCFEPVEMYFDPQTQRYFDCKANKWIESEKPSAEKLATGDVKPVSFAKGTRQPDRWGL